MKKLIKIALVGAIAVTAGCSTTQILTSQFSGMHINDLRMHYGEYAIKDGDTYGWVIRNRSAVTATHSGRINDSGYVSGTTSYSGGDTYTKCYLVKAPSQIVESVQPFNCGVLLTFIENQK